MTIKLVGSTSGSVSLQAPASTTGGAHRLITLPDRNQTGLGSILQVIQAVKTDTASTTINRTSDWVGHGLSISITPSSASSKIFITGYFSLGIDNDENGADNADYVTKTCNKTGRRKKECKRSRRRSRC